jgi:hypothetical protein
MVSIELEELKRAQADRRVSELLHAAEAEGVTVRREGRQRW